jgi:hypothetical protein
MDGSLELTSVSPADQRRSISVKESGEAWTWKEAVVRKRRFMRVVVVVGKCMVAVWWFFGGECVLVWFDSMRVRG